MSRSIGIKGVFVLVFLLALGITLGTGFQQRAEAASHAGQADPSCSTVSGSVYAAVYSVQTGIVSCYSTASFVLPADGGAQYEVSLVSDTLPVGDRIWIKQGSSTYPLLWLREETSFPMLSVSNGERINISIIPELYSSLVLLKPVQSFVYAPTDSVFRYEEEYYRTYGLDEGEYDVLVHKPYRPLDLVKLVDGGGTVLNSLTGVQQQGSLDADGNFWFSNVRLGGSKSAYLLYQNPYGPESYFPDGLYIGRLDSGKGLLKIRFYDSQSTATQIQVNQLDGATVGIAGIPAPNLMFIWKDLIERYESWEFPDWKHQVKLTVTNEGVPASYTMLSEQPHPCDECGEGLSENWDVNLFWSVQLLVGGSPAPANIKVFARVDSEFWATSAYTDAQGKVTFTNRSPETTYVVRTFGETDLSEDKPQYIQLGPFDGNTLSVMPLKQPGAEGQPFNLQDAVRIAKQWQGSGMYDFDQSDSINTDDLNFFLYLLMPYYPALAS